MSTEFLGCRLTRLENIVRLSTDGKNLTLAAIGQSKLSPHLFMISDHCSTGEDTVG